MTALPVRQGPMQISAHPGAGAQADSRSIAALRRFSEAAAIAAMISGFLVLIGWALDIAVLKSVAPGLVTMKPNTALAFVFAGLSLWALPPRHAGRGARIAAIAGAVLVAAIGALSLGEDVLGWDPGIDQLLFRDSAAAVGTAAPGRMAPATAFNFLLLGAALLALRVPSGYRLAQPIALVAFLVSLLALIGYAYGVDELYRLVPYGSMAVHTAAHGVEELYRALPLPYRSMAVHTAALFAVIAAAVLAAAGDRGWAAYLIGERPGARMLRHVWLPGAGIVFVLGWLRLQGQLIGLYDTVFGLALMVTLAISVLTGLAWRYARVLDRTDAERSRAENALREETALLRLVTDNVPAMIAYTDAEFRYRYANRGFVEFYIGAGAAVEGKTIGELQGEQAQREIRPGIERCLAGELIHFEAKRRNVQGEEREVEVTLIPHRDETGCVQGVHTQVLDITERKRAEERIDYLAQYDAVTGLPNRRLFNDRLALAVARDKRLGTMTALLLLDLDRFKEINETLGQRIGDEVLRAVTARLRERLREVDTVARLGGDEFAVIIESVAEKAQAYRVAEKILEAMAEPLEIEGEDVFVTASIGVALCPADADSSEHLIKNAELAMYQAKLDGRNAVHHYAPDPGPGRGVRLGMESGLRRAIERDELLLHFQPKVDIKTGVITGAEALLRWRNPDLGVVSPADFIPLAEETGLIVPIGEWVLYSACAQASAWRRLGWPLAMAVNLSARQFRQKNLCEMVELALSDSGLAAGQLELEITESMIMHRAEHAITTLRRLRDIGVLLSVDDFGTGYSSLSYLKRFPVYTLKVDQSFVRELHHNADDAAIVRAVIALARSMNLRTVAEGVENEQQLAYLAGLGCDEYQGYHFSKPLPAAEFLSLLQAEQAATRRLPVAAAESTCERAAPGSAPLR